MKNEPFLTPEEVAKSWDFWVPADSGDQFLKWSAMTAGQRIALARWAQKLWWGGRASITGEPEDTW